MLSTTVDCHVQLLQTAMILRRRHCRTQPSHPHSPCVSGVADASHSDELWVCCVWPLLAKHVQISAYTGAKPASLIHTQRSTCTQFSCQMGAVPTAGVCALAAGQGGRHPMQKHYYGAAVLAWQYHTAAAANIHWHWVETHRSQPSTFSINLTPPSTHTHWVSCTLTFHTHPPAGS
jgi:hypothetical protein